MFLRGGRMAALFLSGGDWLRRCLSPVLKSLTADFTDNADRVRSKYSEFKIQKEGLSPYLRMLVTGSNACLSPVLTFRP